MGNMKLVEEVSNIDYSIHNFSHHSRRVAYISMRLSNALKLDISMKKNIYISALLHDIGAVTELHYSHTVDGFIKNHCVIGADIVQSFPIFNNLPDIILYHHENFDGSGPMKLSHDKIPLESQIIRLSDLVELLYDKDIPCFKQKDFIRDWIKSNSNKIFSSTVVEAFLNVSSTDMFWLDLESLSFMDFILDKVTPNLDIYLTLDEFEAIAYIFSNIIDSKSKFTAKHSREISELAFKISKHLGYSPEKCQKMKIAALFHDVGKLAIPTVILDKNGPLDDDEFSVIKSHAYYTFIILDAIGDIDDIHNWASNHHEKLDGNGYPRGILSKSLSEESRIIAVCDIYQALIEDRPYRRGMTMNKAFSILDDMSNKNFVCENALSFLKETLTHDIK
jgi:putative nucleotidyltransferase with HDIG domain